MIRIDALSLCIQPHDMRAGANRLLATVGQDRGRRAGPPRLPVRQRAGPARQAAGARRFWCEGATRQRHSGSFVRASTLLAGGPRAQAAQLAHFN